MKSKLMFRRVVDNALDFLKHSAAEIEKHPKYSVINFCAAVELLLKARLMREHWSLIIGGNQKIDLEKFKRGDFISIGMEEAVQRLKATLGEDLTVEEKTSLNQVREHRNKLVHFFNPQYTGKPSQPTVSKVVAEQCRAWYYLHRLLTGRWKRHFKDYAADFEAVNRTMHGLRVFLKAKYKALAPAIAEEKAKGVQFSTCEACGCKANRERQLLGPLHGTDCLVCLKRSRFLKVPCPNCGKDIVSTELGEGECEACGETIDLDYLIDKYGQHRSPKDEFTHPSHALCSECEHFDMHSVVPIDDEWLCLNCLESFTEAGDCGWCGEFVSGDTEDSHLTGCPMCDGILGHQMGKDD